MRVTNGMLTNTTLNGLYKNMNGINKTYAQMVSGKKIQTVSDDPIIAGRALKLKSSVLETSQYESNVKEASSWMEMTEGALTNIYKIAESIRTKCIEASTGTMDKKDKEIILNEIEELMKQLHEEANVSYGGRYVFSGYKTSDPLILTSKISLKENTILAADLYLGGETKLAENGPGGKNVIKAGSSLGEGTLLVPGTLLKEGDILKSGTSLSQQDAANLLGISFEAGKYPLSNDYTLAAGTEMTAETAKKLIRDNGLTADDFEIKGDVYQLKEAHTLAKGEKVEKQAAEELLGISFKSGKYPLSNDYTLAAGTEMTAETAEKLIRDNGLTADNFEIKGDVYQLKEAHTLTKGEQLEKQVAEELLGIQVSDDSYEIPTDTKIIRPGSYAIERDMILGADTKFEHDLEVDKGTILGEGTLLVEGSVLTKGSEIGAGTLNPAVNGYIDGQEMAYEIGNNSTITVNTLGMDGIFSKLIQSVGSMAEQVKASLEDETITSADLHQMFDDKLEEMDKILLDISQATTDLGSRMKRVEYVESRLTDQKTTLKSLLSETEDIDIEEVYVKFNTQYATYQSALQATSKILTNTLADYL